MSRGEGSDIGNIIVGVVICEWALKVGRTGVLCEEQAV
jgi:hypothetical protein